MSWVRNADGRRREHVHDVYDQFTGGSTRTAVGKIEQDQYGRILLGVHETTSLYPAVPQFSRRLRVLHTAAGYHAVFEGTADS